MGTTGASGSDVSRRLGWRLGDVGEFSEFKLSSRLSFAVLICTWLEAMFCTSALAHKTSGAVVCLLSYSCISFIDGIGVVGWAGSYSDPSLARVDPQFVCPLDHADIQK